MTYLKSKSQWNASKCNLFYCFLIDIGIENVFQTICKELSSTLTSVFVLKPNLYWLLIRLWSYAIGLWQTIPIQNNIQHTSDREISLLGLPVYYIISLLRDRILNNKDFNYKNYNIDLKTTSIRRPFLLNKLIFLI